jgi:hypothetical protein
VTVQNYGDFIFKNSPVYLHSRPEDWPVHMKWPSTSQIVENIAEMARLNWP